MSPAPLALFDLDHTLLAGDSDVLWCEFLIRHGLLPESQRQRNAQMDAGYRSGAVGVAEFCGFYAGLLAGHGPAHWQPWRQRFLVEEVLPRIPESARALVERHRRAGHRLVMTTATHRLITEPTAQALGFADLIATELECVDGCYTGRNAGLPNMRDGKPLRLRAWLAQADAALGSGWGLDEAAVEAALAGASFYSDSINDLPLLCAVGLPVVVDPDARLRAEAQARAWPVLGLHGAGA